MVVLSKMHNVKVAPEYSEKCYPSACSIVSDSFIFIIYATFLQVFWSPLHLCAASGSNNARVGAKTLPWFHRLHHHPRWTRNAQHFSLWTDPRLWSNEVNISHILKKYTYLLDLRNHRSDVVVWQLLFCFIDVLVWLFTKPACVSIASILPRWLLITIWPPTIWLALSMFPTEQAEQQSMKSRQDVLALFLQRI